MVGEGYGRACKIGAISFHRFFPTSVTYTGALRRIKHVTVLGFPRRMDISRRRGSRRCRLLVNPSVLRPLTWHGSIIIVTEFRRHSSLGVLRQCYNIRLTLNGCALRSWPVSVGYVESISRSVTPSVSAVQRGWCCSRRISTCVAPTIQDSIILRVGRCCSSRSPRSRRLLVR